MNYFAIVSSWKKKKPISFLWQRILVSEVLSNLGFKTFLFSQTAEVKNWPFWQAFCLWRILEDFHCRMWSGCSGVSSASSSVWLPDNHNVLSACVPTLLIRDLNFQQHHGTRITFLDTAHIHCRWAIGKAFTGKFQGGETEGKILRM